MAAVLTAAYMGRGLAVSLAVSAFYAAFGPMGVYIAVRPGGGRWRDVMGIYLRPVALSLAAIGPAVLAAWLTPTLTRNDYVYVVWALLLAAAIYLPLAHFAAPRESQEIVSRVHDLWGAVRARWRRAD